MTVRKRAAAIGGTLVVVAALVVPATPASAVEVCDLSIATIVSTGGTDVLGTNGNDVVVYKNTVPSRVWLGGGNDKICVTGARAPVVIYGQSGSDSVFFLIPTQHTDAQHSIVYLDETDGSGTGNDKVQTTGDWNANLRLDVFADNGNNTVLLKSGENIVRAGSGNDTIQGGSNKDIILDAGGSNWIKGGSSHDQINVGGSGTNKIWGEAGDDTITGGSGSDTIDGGTGLDWIRSNGGDDTIEGGSSRDRLMGGSGNDTIAGGAADDCIDGESGNDTVDGGADSDGLGGTCTNTSGVEIRGVHGGSGTDTVRGGEGADRIWGDAGADSLFGDGGNDILYYDSSDPTVDGGAGADDLQEND